MHKMKTSAPPSTPSPSLPRGELSSKPNQVGTVVLYGIPIVSLVIENQERLCLAQISNTLLKQFSYNEIHNRRVALGITCVQCTPVQLEILRRAGAMPVSSRRCGMITRREAERLCKSFLGDNAPPRLPDDFAFSVHHECAWGCRGSFLPSRYNSSRAKCIKCTMCGLFFSPNKFIFHSHRLSAGDKYVQPDAANFNSWRRHMKLSGNPPDEVVFAWEDVKAMFNGGTRKRMLASTVGMSVMSSRQGKQMKSSQSGEVSPSGAVNVGVPAPQQPVVPAPRLPACPELPLPISRVAMDFIYNKPFAFSSYGSFPWLKRNPILFPHTIGENPFFPMEKTYQSAFRPVQQPLEDPPERKEDHEEHEHEQEQTQSDDDVDIETTDDKTDDKLQLSQEQWSPKSDHKLTLNRSPEPAEEHMHPSLVPPSMCQQELLPASALTHRIWNLSRLSFDGTDRTNFLYRQDLHRHFVLAAEAASPSPVSLTSITPKPSLDCSTCINHEPAFSPPENNNKILP